jgi:hypothetical protein
MNTENTSIIQASLAKLCFRGSLLPREKGWIPQCSVATNPLFLRVHLMLEFQFE